LTNDVDKMILGSYVSFALALCTK